MKKIRNLLLLMAVLCLAGCSSDDPQSVAFSIKTFEIGNKTEPVSIEVTANCSWTIQTNSKAITIHEGYQGSGESVLNIVVSENHTYDDLTHQITITSEDGTSSDTFLFIRNPRLD